MNDSFSNLTASTGSLVNPFQCTGRESDTEQDCITIAPDTTTRTLVDSSARIQFVIWEARISTRMQRTIRSILQIPVACSQFVFG